MLVKLGFALVVCMLLATPARAIDVTEPPARLADSPLLITAYGTSGVTGETPNFVEIYNSSSSIAKLNDWMVAINWQATSTAPTGTVPLDPLQFGLAEKTAADEPDIYLRPKQYVTLSFGASVPSARIVATPIVGNRGYIYQWFFTCECRLQPVRKIIYQAPARCMVFG